MSEAAYIAHHGVKGQKWGVRRYQNYDGTLTARGRRRLKSSDTVKKAKTVVNYLSPAKRYANLTDEELAQRIRRRQSEIRLADLEFEAYVPAGVRFAKNITTSSISKGVSGGVSKMITKGTVFAGKTFLKSVFDLDLDTLDDDDKKK